MSASTLAPEATCYYVLDGIPKGPVSEEELDALFAAGTVKDQSQVRTPRSPGWQSCKQWRALRDQPDLPPPAATPTAAPPLPTPVPVPAVATDARHACAGCGKDWPESLMLMDARQWRCRPCFQKLSLKAKRMRERRPGDGFRWLLEHWKGVCITLVTISVVASLVWSKRLPPSSGQTTPVKAVGR